MTLPRRVPWFFNGFRRHCRRLVRKKFSGLRLAVDSAPPPPAGVPVLVALNHPSWWDPVVCAALSLEFGEARAHYAVIDANELPKYWVFRYLGFFGVEPDSVRGAATFLRTGSEILQDDRMLWVTAQGRFADARERPLNLRSGVGHLAARMTAGGVLPIAFEYVFWNQAKPEILVRYGEFLPANPAVRGRDWSILVEAALATALDRLSADAVARDPSRFRSLL
jgi:1-acyl-sn-glycerol-3-phosphate acyltransferase